MSVKTLWIVADCSRAGTIGASKANASVFGAGANDYVIFVGDNAYENGSSGDYTGTFDSTFGAGSGHDVTSRAIAVPGNHEYHTADAGGFRSYWNGRGQMGALPRGGFAHQRGNARAPLDLNGWRLIFLDTAGHPDGSYLVDADPNIWISGYLADLDGWLGGVNGKAALVFGHHARFSPVQLPGGHGNMGGSGPAWDRMFSGANCLIAAWFAGHDHMLSSTKILNHAGAVVSDETKGARFFHSGAGAGSFDPIGPQTWRDSGMSNVYGYIKVTIPDSIGGEPQPVTVQMFQTGGGGTGADAAVGPPYSLSPTGSAPPPPPPGPTATTNAAGAITDTTATLNGTVNPQGTATTYHFEYGTTGSYGSNSPETSAGAGSADVAVSRALTGLTPATTYHYRVVARWADGTTSFGGDRTFATTGGPPPTDVILDDDFNRVVAPGSLGIALTGNGYIVSPPADWEVNGDEAVGHLVSTAVHEVTPQGIPQTADLEWLIQWNLGSPPSVSGQNVTAYFMFRYKSGSEFYRVRVVGNTNDAVTTAIQRVVGGLSTGLGASVTSEPNGTILGGRNFRTRLRIVGGDAPRLQTRTWLATAAEPSGWDVDVPDSTPIVGTGTIRFRASVPAVPASAEGFHIDNWTATSLDVAPPPPPPNTPSISDCPTGGHVTAASTDVHYASTPAPASYEESRDNGVTWSAAAVPGTATLALAVNQTMQFKVRAVGSDGQRSLSAGCTITRDPTGGGTNTPTYTPVAGDLGYRIRSKVTPSNEFGPGSTVVSAWSPPVLGASVLPSHTGIDPSLVGTGAIGDAITVDVGTGWNGVSRFEYQWTKNGSTILGETGQSFVPGTDDAGSEISASVRGCNGEGACTTFVDSTNSIVVSTVLVPPFVIDPPSFVAPGGDANVGEEITIDLGTWGGTPPITFTIQWLRGATSSGPFEPIPGATGIKYRPVPADFGLWLDADVTPHNPATT